MEGFDRELEGLFPRVMERYLRSSQPIGVSLSGGLDTRQLMAFLDNRRHKVSCYTFDSMYRETHDAGLARRVAEACGQSHQVLKLRRDYLTSFPAICEQAISLSDGGLGAGDSYELYLNRIARGIAPIRLTGSYGSEVFRSLRGFKAARPNERLTHPDYREHIDAAIETFDEFSKGNNLTFCLFQQAPSYGYGRVAVEQSQIVLRTPFMDNDLVGLLYRAPESARATTQTQWRLIKQGNPALAAIPTDRGLKGRSGALASRWAYLSSYFLFKADYLYKSGMPQWMEQLHYLLGPLQPERLVIGQHRFYHFRIWFRNELAPYIKDILLDPLTAQRPYFNGASIEPMVLRHIKGDRNYTEDIEKALTLELIQRLFIDENNENAISAGDH
jgi:asparagine synthase (glutamine-hydrolysing)